MTIDEFLALPATTEVLSLMCFQCISPAEIYRRGGHQIGRRAEDEQAFVLRRALACVATHGDRWREAHTDELRAILTKAKPVVGDAAS